MPQLDILASLVKENNIKVITVSEDRYQLSRVPLFFKKNKLYNLPILFDDKGALFKKLGLQGIPSTILISKTGIEVGRVIGIAEWDTEASVNSIRECLG